MLRLLPHGNMEGAVALEADTPAEIDIPAIRAINPSTGNSPLITLLFVCCLTRTCGSVPCTMFMDIERSERARGYS